MPVEKVTNSKGKEVTTRFRVKRGSHHVGNKHYHQGDVVETDQDLEKFDPAKFERLD